MTRSVKRRLDKLERGGPAEMPARLRGLIPALLASRGERAGLERMSDEDRALCAAPDFMARVAEAQEWHRTHRSREAGRLVVEILGGGRCDR